MESDDPEQDGNVNICPMCDRDFATLAGMRQHWTKSHSFEEIQAAIAKNTQDFSQHPPAPNIDNENSPIPNPSHGWNRLHIMAEDTIQQFDIIENGAGGDCLFLALLDFLRNHHAIYNNIPNEANELRKMAVNHIVSNDISRFKDSIATNLMNEIPGLVINDKNDESPQICKENYSNHMLTPGNYGTMAELCAIAEIFAFDFFVLRQSSPSEFNCYRDGFAVATNSETMENSPHLLFTGNIGRGHFRLLNPTEDTRYRDIQPGKYQLAEDYTSSRVISIAPKPAVSPNSPFRQDNTSGIQGNNNDDQFPTGWLSAKR